MMSASYTVSKSAKRDLHQMLNNMKSVKNSSFTHTSIVDPPGSFYIVSECADQFLDIYTTALLNKCDLHLTEKHTDISPILIDLDFRWGEKLEQRKYTMKQVEHFVCEYLQELHKLTQFEIAEVYIMEKPAPVWVDTKGFTKDGLHIVIPNIVTRPAVQLIARERTLKNLQQMIQEINCSNDATDVFDEAVITRNNWQMYGSKKPGSHSYTITNVLKIQLDTSHCSCIQSSGALDVDLTDHQQLKELIQYLSIRNKHVENQLADINTSDRAEIDEVDNKLHAQLLNRESKQRTFDKIIQSRENQFSPPSDDLDTIRQLISILSTERVGSYNDWIRLGWCLRNIDINLLEDWDNLSRASPKYTPGECERLWYYMREGGLGIGSLHMWAKQDAPEQYNSIMSDHIHKYIMKSVSQTDYDIAMVICKMYRHRFRCASVRHGTWYEFKNHRWREVEKGYTLFYHELPTTVWGMYGDAVSRVNSSSRRSMDSIESCETTTDTLNKIRKKFKCTDFTKIKMYKECSGLLLEPNFEEKLDSNPSLLGFENGVYDLSEGLFREGRPEDYVSYSTGINYIEYDPNNPLIEEVNHFISKVLTDDDVREYVMQLLASMLDGSNRDEKFHIWTGSGSNGKSKMVELFQMAIGDYACIFNVSMLTQKRVSSNATNSELAIAKGKRFAILQEPEENERLNVGFMKELTGGDKIQCRGLFKEPIRFKPMFTMILTCNHMPAIPPDDGGTWRRVRRVEFSSKFVDTPNIKNPNEFKRDNGLSEKFEAWVETFMTILLQYYEKYKIAGKIIEPKKVLEYTREYQRKNDIFADFCDKYIVKETGCFLPVSHMFQLFREYCNQDNIRNSRDIKKSDFQSAMEKRYGLTINVGKNNGWKGLSARIPEDTEKTEDLDKQSAVIADNDQPAMDHVFG